MDDETRIGEQEPAGKPDPITFPLCPHLFLRDDAQSCALYPRLDHRCRLPGVAPPSLAWQQRYCLGQHHTLCPHYRVHGKEAPPPVAERAATRRWRRAGLVAGTLVVLGGGVAFRVGDSSARQSAPERPTSQPGGAAPATASVPATLSTIPTPAATAQPPPTPAPTAAPTVAPTAAPTAAPATPTPTPPPAPATSTVASATPTVPRPTTYVVESGDTLASIASRFGTSVDALMTLNGITDPNLIHTGTVLALPSP